MSPCAPTPYLPSRRPAGRPAGPPTCLPSSLSTCPPTLSVLFVGWLLGWLVYGCPPTLLVLFMALSPLLIPSCPPPPPPTPPGEAGCRRSPHHVLPSPPHRAGKVCVRVGEGGGGSVCERVGGRVLVKVNSKRVDGREHAFMYPCIAVLLLSQSLFTVTSHVYREHKHAQIETGWYPRCRY